MLDLLLRAGCFVAIILLGFFLRKISMFHAGDFTVISKIVMRVTLPAAIVLSFSQKQIDPAMLSLALVGLLSGVLQMAAAFLLNLRRNKEQKAFEILNYAGLNIGNFTLPFVQSFIGSTAVIVTTLFDIGNAVICLGGSYGVAATAQDGSGFSPKRIFRALFGSVAFDVYIVMVILNLLKVTIPAPVVSCAELIGSANVFLAMLMIGVGFDPVWDKQQLRYIAKFLFFRYLMAAGLALLCYYLLPFDLEVRQTLVLLMFSPLTSTVPAFIGELKGDVGLASTLNSVSILCSIPIIILLLTIML